MQVQEIDFSEVKSYAILSASGWGKGRNIAEALVNAPEHVFGYSPLYVYCFNCDYENVGLSEHGGFDFPSETKFTKTEITDEKLLNKFEMVSDQLSGAIDELRSVVNI